MAPGQSTLCHSDSRLDLQKKVEQIWPPAIPFHMKDSKKKGKKKKGEEEESNDDGNFKSFKVKLNPEM